ncbi:MAG: dihydroorotase, partial [Methanobacteriota archaeon]
MLIKNCKIVGSRGIVEGDILVEGERIAKIGRNLKSDGGGPVIDAKGSPVMPGVIDSHVHIRDFKESYKEDY